MRYKAIGDLLSSAYTIRTQEARTSGKGRTQGTVALPEMRQGRIALSFVTLFARSTGRPSPHSDFASPAQSYGIAKGQLAYYRALERMGYVRIIANRRTIRQAYQHLADVGKHSDRRRKRLR